MWTRWCYLFFLQFPGILNKYITLINTSHYYCCMFPIPLYQDTVPKVSLTWWSKHLWNFNIYIGVVHREHSQLICNHCILILKLSFSLRTGFPSLLMTALVQRNLRLWSSFDSLPLHIFKETGCGQVGVFLSRVTFHLIRLLRASFNLALNTSGWGSTTSVGNVFQFLITLTVKNFSLT